MDRPVIARTQDLFRGYPRILQQRTIVVLLLSCALLYTITIAQYCTEKELDAVCDERRSEFHVELVQVVMRHGERAPLLKESYPKDIYNSLAYEPLGLSQLTNTGKMTEYRIGTMLRQRYDYFLGSIYRPQDVYAISTDVDRTKMSLQLALAGLYPPQEIQEWNPDLKWLGIPIYYIPKSLDVVMKSHNCPKFQATLKELRGTDEVREKLAVYSDFFEFLSEETGLNVTGSEDVFELYHGLTAQKCMNLTLPKWCTDEVYRKIEEIVTLEYNFRSYTTQMKRLNGGNLVKRLINNMNPKGNPKNKPSRKIYFYSGHETNIAAFAKAHNLTQPKVPNYGSAFIVEKLRKEDNFYVRILYWTGVTQELITMKLEHCGEVCPMETYLELTRDIIPSDEETTCLWDNITKKEIMQLYIETMNYN